MKPTDPLRLALLALPLTFAQAGCEEGDEVDDRATARPLASEAGPAAAGERAGTEPGRPVSEIEEDLAREPEQIREKVSEMLDTPEGQTDERTQGSGERPGGDG